MSRAIENLTMLYRKLDDLNAKAEILEVYSLEYRDYLKKAHAIYEEVRVILENEIKVVKKENM